MDISEYRMITELRKKYSHIKRPIFMCLFVRHLYSDAPCTDELTHEPNKVRRIHKQEVRLDIGVKGRLFRVIVRIDIQHIYISIDVQQTIAAHPSHPIVIHHVLHFSRDPWDIF